MSLSFEEYRALPGLNWSLLKHAAESPKRFKYFESHDRPDTLAMLVGRAVHCSVLEPDRFPLEFPVWQGGRRQGKTWESFVDALPVTASVLSISEYERCLAIRDAVRAHPVAARLLDREGTLTEHVVQWTDKDTGLDCKARFDAVNPYGYLLDLKTTQHIDERRFTRTVADMAYHAQAAFYCAGFESAYGAGQVFYFIAVESEPPHDVAVYVLDDDSLWAGEELVKSLLRRVKDCRETGQWPGMYPTLQTLTLPAWAFPDDGTKKLEGLAP